MAQVISLQNGALPLPSDVRSALGLSENDSVLVDVQAGQLIVRSLCAAEQARERLLAHLRLPVGALAHLVEQPTEPVTIEDELGGDIYEDID